MFKRITFMIAATAVASTATESQACNLFGLFRFPQHSCAMAYEYCPPTACSPATSQQKCVEYCMSKENSVAAAPKMSVGPGPRWTITDTSKGLVLIDQLQGKFYERKGEQWVENKELVLPPGE